MKDENTVRKDVENILKTINKDSTKFDIIVKQRLALEDYYSKNIDKISKYALIKRYKKLKIDNKNITTYLMSFVIGVLSSFIYSAISSSFLEKVISNVSFENACIKRIISLILCIIAILFITFIIFIVIMCIFKLYKNANKTTNYFTDDYQAMLIEKILLKKHKFKINVGIDDIKFTDKTQESKDDKKE